MWRIRFLKILLPAILIPFLILVALELRRRPAPLGQTAGEPVRGSRAEGVKVIDLEGIQERLKLNARTYAKPEEGRQQVEGVERLEVARDDQGPLLIRAERADIRGEAPNRFVVVEGGLDVQDDDAGMSLSLPTLEIDEAAGEARSAGDVRFEAPGYRGRAAAVIYGLIGQPTVFTGVVIENDDGAVLRSGRARFIEGSDDLELYDGVRIERDGTWLNAPRMLAFRDPDTHDLRRVLAEDGVTGEEVAPGAAPISFRSHRMEADWNETGQPASLLLMGDAEVDQGDRGVTASVIRAQRVGGSTPGRRVEAEGEVSARGTLPDGPATLTADRIHVLSDEDGELVDGMADGQIRFESVSSLATADHADLSRENGLVRIDMTTNGDRKARVANEDTRVAADRIVTWAGTRRMQALGRAESTLMPSSDDADAPRRAAMFDGSKAIHFVSRQMETSLDGEQLTFLGGVRGWQGDRNLSTDELRVYPSDERLHAIGNVATRFPRIESEALTQADYIQVASEELTFRGAENRATFSGDVRLRQAEGWLESERLEIEMSPDGGGLDLLRAIENVKVEFQSPDRDGILRPIRGTGDRVEYTPGESLVRLFGERSPATATKPDAGGTTTLHGRVLRYRLDDGTVEVEAGDQDRAKIRTADS